jgi:hypothetical protein
VRRLAAPVYLFRLELFDRLERLRLELRPLPEVFRLELAPPELFRIELLPRPVVFRRLVLRLRAEVFRRPAFRLRPAAFRRPAVRAPPEAFLRLELFLPPAVFRRLELFLPPAVLLDPLVRLELRRRLGLRRALERRELALRPPPPVRFLGRPLRLVPAISSRSSSLIDSYIPCEAPCSSDALSSPRLALRAAPAAICCFFEVAFGMGLLPWKW